VQLDSSATKDKKPTLKPTQEFKFLPHRTFRRWRFGYCTLQHICSLSLKAEIISAAKELQFPITFFLLL
jgi:hypothetical protein